MVSVKQPALGTSTLRVLLAMEKTALFTSDQLTPLLKGASATMAWAKSLAGKRITAVAFRVDCVGAVPLYFMVGYLPFARLHTESARYWAG